MRYKCSAPTRLNDVPNTSVQMQATGAQQPWKRLNAMVTFLTFKVAAKRLPTSNATPKTGSPLGSGSCAQLVQSFPKTIGAI